MDISAYIYYKTLAKTVNILQILLEKSQFVKCHYCKTQRVTREHGVPILTLKGQFKNKNRHHFTQPCVFPKLFGFLKLYIYI